MFTLATGWMTVWLYWMAFAITVTPLVLLFSKETRIDAVIVFLTNIAMLVGMSWLYDAVGYVRLMGIVHVILWTPLFIYLVRRAKNGEMPCPAGLPCGCLRQHWRCLWYSTTPIPLATCWVSALA